MYLPSAEVFSMVDSTTVNEIKSSIQQISENLKKIEGPIDNLFSTTVQITEASKAMYQAGADFARLFHPETGEVSTGIDSLAQKSAALFGTVQEGIDAYTTLGVNMRSFVGVAKEQQENLADITMRMTALGFEAESLTQIMDNQAMAFGASADQLQKHAAMMNKISRDLYIEPKKLLTDFIIAQENFAYTSEKTMDVFARMQKQARETGLAFSDMAKSFGSELDTFGGATQMAGKINAILGESALNPLELLGADEATRMKLVQDALKKSPVASEALARGNKFEIKAMSSALGMSPLQLRKLLSDEGEIKGALQKRLDERAKEGYGPESETMTKLADSASFAQDQIMLMTDAIKNLRLESENERIRIANAARGAGVRALRAAARSAGVSETNINMFGDQPDMLRQFIEAKAYGFGDEISPVDAILRTRTGPDQAGRAAEGTRGSAGIGAALEEIAETSGAYGEFFASALNTALPKDVLTQTLILGAMNDASRERGSLADRIRAQNDQIQAAYEENPEEFGRKGEISPDQQAARDRLARNQASKMVKGELDDAMKFGMKKYNLAADWTKRAASNKGASSPGGTAPSAAAQQELMEKLQSILGEDMARLISAQLVKFIKSIVP